MRTRAPPRVRPAPPAAPPAAEPGYRYARSYRGVLLVGVQLHELPREDVQLASRAGLLFDPVEIGELLEAPPDD